MPAYYSRLFLPTLKESPAEAETPSHRLMLRAGLIRKVASGIYNWLPFGLRALQKVEQIVREEMNRIDGQEVLLPTLHPRELWEETGRWGVYGKELMRIKDRHDREFCLGPTAEEVITDLVRGSVNSYRQLPLTLYQFQSKFRDEIRPRFGVMRAREFLMKDAYSFHASDEDANRYYERAVEAYKTIFRRCGLQASPVEADSGAIGGSQSHEFMVHAPTGEEAIVVCSGCGYAANTERAGVKDPTDPCPRCKAVKLQFSRGIEVGHTFKLGDKYTASMKASYLDEKGQSQRIVMGCYGIGVSRVVAACIEQCNDANGIVWPLAIAPYEVTVLLLDPGVPSLREAGEKLADEFEKAGYSVLVDDRDERPGIKFKDADLLGAPLRVTVGQKSMATGNVEVKRRSDRDSVVVELSKAFSEGERLLKV